MEPNKYAIEQVTFVNGIRQPKTRYHHSKGHTLEEANDLLSVHRDNEIAFIKSIKSYELIGYGLSQHRTYVEYIDHNREPGDDYTRIEFNIMLCSYISSEEAHYGIK